MIIESGERKQKEYKVYEKWLYQWNKRDGWSEKQGTFGTSMGTLGRVRVTRALLATSNRLTVSAKDG